MITKLTVRFLRISLCSSMLLATAGTAAWAQAGRGGINGTITDPSGAIVPGARITALNHATGVSQSTVTTRAGLYDFVALNPGSYRVTATLKGFETVAEENVTVSVDQVTAVNIALRVGSVNEVVTVSSSSDVMDTNNSTAAGIVPNIIAQVSLSLTGIMLATSPFDWQLGNSYFVVAHFHYVIVGGILFALFGAFYYWFPKMSGRMYSETLAKWHFWLFLIGFHLTFDFMHIPGMLGMPRRIYTYEPGRGWEIWNLIVTVGVLFQIAGVLAFVGNLLRSLAKGELAGNDPWDAWTLEWSTTSPPPEYNFARIPVVESRRPLWDVKHPEDPDWKYE